LCLCDDAVAVVAEQEIAGGGASVWLLRELTEVVVVLMELCLCMYVYVCVSISVWIVACRHMMKFINSSGE
jgi:hypothetical protein